MPGPAGHRLLLLIEPCLEDGDTFEQFVYSGAEFAAKADRLPQNGCLLLHRVLKAARLSSMALMPARNTVSSSLSMNEPSAFAPKFYDREHDREARARATHLSGGCSSDYQLILRHP